LQQALVLNACGRLRYLVLAAGFDAKCLRQASKGPLVAAFWCSVGSLAVQV
jgi:hypothetical protein